MTLRRRHPVYAAGIVERHDNHVLIVLPRGADETLRHWQFPRGKANADESPETAMRRVASQQLGLNVEIVVGQPPVLARIDGEEVEMRFFFCGIIEGTLRAGEYAETAWIHKAHLREYEFDEVSMPVVKWMLEERG